MPPRASTKTQQGDNNTKSKNTTKKNTNNNTRDNDDNDDDDSDQNNDNDVNTISPLSQVILHWFQNQRPLSEDEIIKFFTKSKEEEWQNYFTQVQNLYPQIFQSDNNPNDNQSYQHTPKKKPLIEKFQQIKTQLISSENIHFKVLSGKKLYYAPSPHKIIELVSDLDDLQHKSIKADNFLTLKYEPLLTLAKQGREQTRQRMELQDDEIILINQIQKYEEEISLFPPQNDPKELSKLETKIENAIQGTNIVGENLYSIYRYYNKKEWPFAETFTTFRKFFELKDGDELEDLPKLKRKTPGKINTTITNSNNTVQSNGLRKSFVKKN